MTIQDIQQAHDLIRRLEADIKAINTDFQIQCSVCMHAENGAVLPGYACADDQDMIRLLSAQIMNYGIERSWDIDALASFLDSLVQSVGINYMSVGQAVPNLKS